MAETIPPSKPYDPTRTSLECVPLNCFGCTLDLAPVKFCDHDVDMVNRFAELSKTFGRNPLFFEAYLEVRYNVVKT